MGRWRWFSSSTSTFSESKHRHEPYLPRQRDTLSDYCIARPTPPPSHDLLVDFAVRNDAFERDRDELERHVDTFSDELELEEPSTLAGRFTRSLRNGGALHPQSYWHLAWLLLVSACFVFNCIGIPLRSTFPYQTEANWLHWLLCDLACDAVYLLDLVLVKPHVIFLYDGFWVRDKRLTRKHYFAKCQFKMDILSLTPLDLLYLKYGKEHVLFRLPRLLKIQTFWELFDHLDSLLMSPYLVRVARTLCYMMYLVHLNACGYYAFSAREGLGTNNWTYKGGDGNAYIRCFYFATKTATSVGKNPRPETEGEYLFMTCSWLMGVFVFALLIGQVRDIVATASRTRTEHRKRLDETLEHMRGLSLPERVQKRVQSWFTFADQHQPFDEARILNSLPQKLKTDVAIDVHGGTLAKVHLFNKIADPALIRDLVLKLRSVIYLPGDFICRKNEVGKEMYIVKTGKVEVLAPPTNGTGTSEVLATLGEGSVFGEISLLALAGGNRRTADVRSKGFSNLFVLSKNDLHETLVYYPDAQKILKQKAEQLMRENADRERRESRLLRGSAATTPDDEEVMSCTDEDVTTGSDGSGETGGSGGEEALGSVFEEQPQAAVKIRVTAEHCFSPTPQDRGPSPCSLSVSNSASSVATQAAVLPEDMVHPTEDTPTEATPPDIQDGTDADLPAVRVTPVVAEHDSDLTSVTCTSTTTRSSRASSRPSASQHSSCSTCTCSCSCSCSLSCGEAVALADWDADEERAADTLSDLSSTSLLSPLRLSPTLDGRRPSDLQRRRESAPTPDTAVAEGPDGSLLVPHRLSFPTSRKKHRSLAHRTRSNQ